MEIREDDLRGPEIARLLQAHLDTMAAHSPPESVFALDLDALRSPDITFWTVWEEDDLVGCGALREIDNQNGEIKSMHTAAAHRGKGIAQTLLTHVLTEAKRRSYDRISLEIGSVAAFAPARALYARNGFVKTGSFGDYEENPFSLFMTLDLRTEDEV
tara:strand:+ start:226 stop:699 length:474 start_codon:yes stop_codon:yes gene_type:complete